MAAASTSTAGARTSSPWATATNSGHVGGDENQFYTATFSGTSSASPIVAGAAASLQGAALADGQGALSPGELRQLLASTGTPQDSHPKNIGPMPDLEAALDELLNGTNNPPVAVDDEFTVACGAPFFDMSNSDLVANDSDPDGDLLKPCLAGPASHGTVSQFSWGFRYVPDPAFWVYGEDAFPYRASDGPSCPGNSNPATVTLTADCFGSGPESFHDSFEGGDLSAWAGQWIPGGGALIVNDEAALSGELGLEVVIDSTTSIAMLTQNTPPAENHFHAAFLVAPGELTIGEGDSLALFVGLEWWNGPHTAQLRLRRSSGQYQLRLDTWDDDATYAAIPSWVPIAAGSATAVHVEWWSAAEPGSNDGGVRLRVDGELAGEVTGLDNDEKIISRVRFGALGVDPGTTGSLYLDAFRSWSGDQSRSVVSATGFDDGVLPWSTWIPNGGSIEVTTAATITGRYGMEVELVPGGTHVFTSDLGPQAEDRCERDYALVVRQSSGRL